MSSYDKVRDGSPVDATKPHAWIQWKGTNVCADVYCSCGYRGHIDDDFTYSVKCGRCGAIWGMDPNVTLVALDPADVEGECEPRLVEDDPEDDEDWRTP